MQSAMAVPEIALMQIGHTEVMKMAMGTNALSASPAVSIHEDVSWGAFGRGALPRDQPRNSFAELLSASKPPIANMRLNLGIGVLVKWLRTDRRPSLARGEWTKRQKHSEISLGQLPVDSPAVSMGQIISQILASPSSCGMCVDAHRCSILPLSRCCLLGNCPGFRTRPLFPFHLSVKKVAMAPSP
jgi:hypothetical protein